MNDIGILFEYYRDIIGMEGFCIMTKSFDIEDIEIEEKDIRNLIRTAMKVRDMAYARYSGFKVGAALLAGCKVSNENETDSNTLQKYRVFTGGNIENSSYGATICAERAAVCNAVSSGYTDFKAIAIVGGLNNTGINGITYPCGICRQVLSEFSVDMYVIAARSEEEYDMRRLSEFLPASFDAGQMV